MSAMFYVVCLIGIAPWVVAEWMLGKEVVRVSRDTEMRCRERARTVITAVADIPLVCFSLLAGLECATIMRTPNGYCFHFSGESLGIALICGLLVGFALAPIYGLLNGLVCFLFFWVSLGAVGPLKTMAFAMSAFYLLVGAFMRGKIMWRAPGRSKWWAFFVFWATYWPLLLLGAILEIAEDTANATGHCCWDM